MLVYRLEHRQSGKGPFGTLWMYASRFPETYRPPCPHDDDAVLGINRGSDVRCGTVSLVQLFAVWFTNPDIDLEARENEYVIAIYDVDDDDVAVGGHQCCFRRAQAQKLHQHDMRELRDTYQLYKHALPAPPEPSVWERVSWHLTSDDFLLIDRKMIIQA